MSRLTFPNVLLISILLRITLILYSEWHDARSLVKYTDVDYRVFSDAARFLLNFNHDSPARGPLKDLPGLQLNLGDPYARDTYRYTPLLALLLSPNEWLHPSFGKFLFATCDIVNGIILYNLLLHQRLATLYSAVYLLNPLVFSISTRGSSESVLSLFVLLTLHAALCDQWDKAALWLGVSAHWKIYPVIYGVSCLGVVVGASNVGVRFRSLVNWRTARFPAISAGTFFALGLGCYLIWGYPFLFESYLYHLHRLDHRHNFSPYFYLTYLTYPSASSASLGPASWASHLIRSPLASFVPQMSLALGTGLLFGKNKDDLAFAWFVQTVVFVLFNKVCTSQYFLWYLLFLPLLLPRLHISPKRALVYVGVWIGTQALWLAEAYKLEFLGENVFFGLWARSLVYVAGNCWVLAGVMDGYL
ncbi:glycosyltransferase family 50 protein [Amanita thiersii Skay4041]|uniref:GPI mannosyltransferase 1 n=1 Tax=Amanita thiersii Skay4041 TaxID=703135 RepID=A0A2A9ND65_9AGAR|nr:glycosyltransferase family 50 protein [Amanita thiersii Skay4041]